MTPTPAQRIVLVPDDDIYDGKYARVVGREGGWLDAVVSIEGQVLVLKTRTPRRLRRPVMFEVWEIAEPGFVRDWSTQQVVDARLVTTFAKAARLALDPGAGRDDDDGREVVR